MALDIAVIQDKYGVNEDWATGNDTYVLKDVNEWGVYIDAATGQPAVHDATNQATARDGYYEGQSTYYSSIWDAGRERQHRLFRRQGHQYRSARRDAPI